MKKLLHAVLVFIPLIANSFELKRGENFAYEILDYKTAPVYKDIQKHPENYSYLDSVNLYRILYLSDSLKITGLMVTPKMEGDFPVVVFNRGGNREYGALKISSATNVMAPIAKQGYVVVAGNYRGNSGSEGVEEFGGADVNDVINLAKTVSAFQQADVSKIGLIGISRGGMMNYLTLRENQKHNLPIKCVINIGGITDLEKTIEYHPEIGTVCEEIIPNFSADKFAAYKKRSVIYWVNELPKKCPMLLLHSYDDASVTYEQIPSFIDSLEKYQLMFKHIAYKKDNHGIVKHREHVQEQIDWWLNAYLKNEFEISPNNKFEIVK